MIATVSDVHKARERPEYPTLWGNDLMLDIVPVVQSVDPMYDNSPGKHHFVWDGTTRDFHWRHSEIHNGLPVLHRAPLDEGGHLTCDRIPGFDFNAIDPFTLAFRWSHASLADDVTLFAKRQEGAGHHFHIRCKGGRGYVQFYWGALSIPTSYDCLVDYAYTGLAFKQHGTVEGVFRLLVYEHATKTFVTDVQNTVIISDGPYPTAPFTLSNRRNNDTDPFNGHYAGMRAWYTVKTLEELEPLLDDWHAMYRSRPTMVGFADIGAPPSGRLMASMVDAGGLVAAGGLAGRGGGLAA